MRWRFTGVLVAIMLSASACTTTTYYPAQILAIEFARGVSSDGTPIEPARQFPAGINTIYAIFEVGGVKANDVISSILYRGTEKILDQKYTVSQVFGGPVQAPRTMWTINQFSPVDYVATPHPSGATPGSYRLELSINGKVMRSGTFDVLPQ